MCKEQPARLQRFFIIAFLLSFILCSLSSSASDTTKVAKRNFFSRRDFGKYFLSDIYAPLNSIQVGFGLNLKEYNISSTRKARFVPYNETNLAVEVPIYKSSRILKKGNESKFSLSIPISANIWFDFFEKTTAPILNTDYRFGVCELNYLREINRGLIRNLSIKFIPLFHESTHLGDELTLYRAQDSLPLVRVNVSYEVSEFAITLNDPNGTVENNHSFKVGARFLIRPSKGWYSIRPVEGDTSLVVKTNKSIETYFQYQHQRSRGFLAGEKAMFVFSLEVMNRVKYNYPFDLSPIQYKGEIGEGRLCVNTYVGWRLQHRSDNEPRFGIYLRHYTGINPHGQFRSIPFYDFLGLSIVYEN
jgi:hypothetical protein